MIAVIAAMDKEVDAIVSIMESHEHLMKSGIDFDKGILAGKELLVMKSGVGKGNAGMATTILLENFSIDCIVNIGTAGGLQVQQNILDAVISTQVVQHDTIRVLWMELMESVCILKRTRILVTCASRH